MVQIYKAIMQATCSIEQQSTVSPAKGTPHFSKFQSVNWREMKNKIFKPAIANHVNNELK